jgi:hypothetical protein
MFIITLKDKQLIPMCSYCGEIVKERVEHNKDIETKLASTHDMIIDNTCRTRNA